VGQSPVSSSVSQAAPARSSRSDRRRTCPPRRDFLLGAGISAARARSQSPLKMPERSPAIPGGMNSAAGPGGEARGERGHPVRLTSFCPTNCVGLHSALACRPGPRGERCRRCPPKPGAAPSLALCCFAPPDTIAAGVAGPRPNGHSKSRVWRCCDFAGRDAEAEARTGRAALAGARCKPGSPALAPPT